MKKQAVFFDLGGTLLEYHPEEVLKALLHEAGIEVSASDARAAYRTVEPLWIKSLVTQQELSQLSEEALTRFDRMVLEQLRVDADLDKLARYVNQNWVRMDQNLPQDVVRKRYSDVLPCLEKVRSLSLKMGIVSNISSEDQLRRDLNSLGLTEFFPTLVASGSVGFAKPAKEIFDIAIGLVRLSPEQILFVGDDLEKDYKGAKRAGMSSTLIDREGKHRKLPDINRVSSLEQIPKLLE